VYAVCVAASARSVIVSECTLAALTSYSTVVPVKGRY